MLKAEAIYAGLMSCTVAVLQPVNFDVGAVSDSVVPVPLSKICGMAYQASWQQMPLLRTFRSRAQGQISREPPRARVRKPADTTCNLFACPQSSTRGRGTEVRHPQLCKCIASAFEAYRMGAGTAVSSAQCIQKIGCV